MKSLGSCGVGVSGYPPKVQDRLLRLTPLTATAETQHLAAPLDFGSNGFFICVCHSGPFPERWRKLLLLSRAQNRRRLCRGSRLPRTLLCQSGRVIQQLPRP